MGDSITRLDLDRLFDQLYRIVVFALLMRNQSEQMQCIDVSRVAFEYLPIQLRRMLQVPALVCGDGNRKHPPTRGFVGIFRLNLDLFFCAHHFLSSGQRQS
jgi:hypothetical protein